MDDMNAFERRVADESQWLLGPARPVDDAAVFAAIVSAQAPQQRSISMFNALKFMAASVILAAIGGFLLLNLPATAPDEPGASSIEASPSGSPTVSGSISTDLPVAAGQRLVVTVAGLPGRGGDEPLGQFQTVIEEEACGLQVPFDLVLSDAAADASGPLYADVRLEDPADEEIIGLGALPARVKLDEAASEPISLEVIDALVASGRYLHWPGTLESSFELPEGVDEISYVVSLVERGAEGEPNITIGEVVVCGVTDPGEPVDYEMRWDANDVSEDQAVQYGVEARVVAGLSGEVLGFLPVERWMRSFDFNYETFDDPMYVPLSLSDMVVPPIP